MNDVHEMGQPRLDLSPARFGRQPLPPTAAPPDHLPQTLVAEQRRPDLLKTMRSGRACLVLEVNIHDRRRQGVLEAHR